MSGSAELWKTLITTYFFNIMDYNHKGNNDGHSDFEPIKDGPLSVADQFNHWFGWLLEQGYSPLEIQSGLTMAAADFAGFIYETFDEEDDCK